MQNDTQTEPLSRDVGAAGEGARLALETPVRPKRRVLFGVFFAAMCCEVLGQTIWRLDLAPPFVSTLLDIVCGCLLLSVVYYVVRQSRALRAIRFLILLSGACIVTWGVLDIVISLPELAGNDYMAIIRSTGRAAAVLATVGFITCVMLGFLLSLLNALDVNFLLAKEQEGLLQEVAERSRAETALRQSEARQRLLYNSVQAGIVVQSASGDIVDSNHVAAEFFGLAIGEMQGRSALDLGWRMVNAAGRPITHEERPSMSTVRTGVPIRNLLLGVTSEVSGALHWLLVNTEPLFEPMRTAVSEVLITFQDVTELKQAQEDLRESEARFRAIFDTSPIAIVEAEFSALWRRLAELRELGMDDLRAYLDDHPEEVAHLSTLVKILDFNAATVRIMGAADKNSIVRALPAYFTGDSLAVFKDQIVTLARGVPATEHEMPIVNAVGQPIWLAVSLAIQPTTDAASSRVLVSFIDVTSRRRAEDERLRLERQIQQTQRLESLGVLAGGIAHDFNNILMAILGHADLAQDELPPTSAVRESLSEIELAARRASELCRQMLAYSGRGRFVVETIVLRDIVEEMVQLLSTSISKKATVTLRLEDNRVCMKGDATQVRQIVMNLVVNAAEALGDEPGVITVTTGTRECTPEFLNSTVAGEELAPGPYAYLEVRDTGCGMAPDTLARIFEPFYTTKFTGRGLGMSAVLGIVRGHKGTLTIQSEPGQGSTFTILFPAIDEMVPPRNRKSKALKDTWKGSGCVLVVDDERPVRSLAKRMLTRLGFDALFANDGREAVDLYAERRGEVDFVLLDLTMPNMNGEEALHELRRVDPDIRVILSSGYTEQEIAARFEGKGLAGFIQKPYTLEVLRNCLRSLTDGKAGKKSIRVFEEPPPH